MTPAKPSPGVHPSARSRKTSKAEPASTPIVIPREKEIELRLGARSIRLTNLDKIFFPELGLTKRDLLQYYADIAPVLLPHIRPALIAGGLLAFTLSLDDFVITFFTSGPDTVTFPVKVYSMLRFSVTPEVNAASTMLILLTVILMVVMMVLQNRAAKKIKG